MMHDPCRQQLTHCLSTHHEMKEPSMKSLKKGFTRVELVVGIAIPTPWRTQIKQPKFR